MPTWLLMSLIASLLWGAVGFLQKLGTTRGSADSLMVWMMLGYILFLPFLIPFSELGTGSRDEIVTGILVGMTNGLGAWFLLMSMESGGKAAIAIPVTALYPVVTNFLVMLFFKERLTTWQWWGVVGAIVGGVMMSYETKPKDAAGEPVSSPAQTVDRN